MFSCLKKSLGFVYARGRCIERSKRSERVALIKKKRRVGFPCFLARFSSSPLGTIATGPRTFKISVFGSTSLQRRVKDAITLTSENIRLTSATCVSLGQATASTMANHPRLFTKHPVACSLALLPMNHHVNCSQTTRDIPST
jgi:hypothetical protein